MIKWDEKNKNEKPQASFAVPHLFFVYICLWDLSHQEITMMLLLFTSFLGRISYSVSRETISLTDGYRLGYTTKSEHRCWTNSPLCFDTALCFSLIWKWKPNFGTLLCLGSPKSITRCLTRMICATAFEYKMFSHFYHKSKDCAQVSHTNYPEN